MSEATTTELEPETETEAALADMADLDDAADRKALEDFRAEVCERSRKIAKLRAALAKAQSDKKAAAAREKEAEEILDDAERQLNEFVTADAAPLFDAPAKAGSNGRAEAPADAWKAVPLAELEGIPGGTLEKLTEADPPVLTIDDFRRWQESGGKIRGLGPEKIAKVSDAIIGYFEVHPVGEPPITVGPANALLSAAINGRVSLGRADDDATDRADDDEPSDD